MEFSQPVTNNDVFFHPPNLRDASDPVELKRRLELLAWMGCDSDTDTDDDEWITELEERLPYYRECEAKNNQIARQLIQRCE